MGSLSAIEVVPNRALKKGGSLESMATKTDIAHILGHTVDDGRCKISKTKIVCTLGPKSREVPVLEKLLRAGMNVARFNFSHGTHEYHQYTLDNLRQAMHNTQTMCAVLLDTKVPPPTRLERSLSSWLMLRWKKLRTICLRLVLIHARKWSSTSDLSLLILTSMIQMGWYKLRTIIDSIDPRWNGEWRRNPRLISILVDSKWNYQVDGRSFERSLILLFFFIFIIIEMIKSIEWAPQTICLC